MSDEDHYSSEIGKKCMFKGITSFCRTTQIEQLHSHSAGIPFFAHASPPDVMHSTEQLSVEAEAYLYEEGTGPAT